VVEYARVVSEQLWLVVGIAQKIHDSVALLSHSAYACLPLLAISASGSWPLCISSALHATGSPPLSPMWLALTTLLLHLLLYVALLISVALALASLQPEPNHPHFPSNYRSAGNIHQSLQAAQRLDEGRLHL